MRHLPLLLLLPFCWACRPAPVARPYAPPTASQLYDALRARADHLRTLREEAKIDHMGPGGERVKLTVDMLLECGGKLRLEAQNPLGGSLATLVTDGQDFAYLDVRGNRFLVGPASPCNVARLIRVELPPDEVVHVLMGGAPLDGQPVSDSWDPNDGGREVLTLQTVDGGRETLWLDAAARRWDVVAAERHDRAGTLQWRLEHSDFEQRGGFRLPTHTHIEQPPVHADVLIRVRSAEPNITPPPDIFHLSPPAGLTPEPVTCN